ncbi:ABC transporter permease [Kitasatospora sp. NBC_01287]|uniref:ABC transporter permease n=1 Tax=Kitasatospora sp. NBC_01287 TaxID=2903573 RepID=UPI00225817A0|nr:ABC transporter permease [Kitasatospora sp. NBC_01287]MCX4747591.1 ABC transporter permease [Kitasatospora sp. NBC_01287]
MTLTQPMPRQPMPSQPLEPQRRPLSRPVGLVRTELLLLRRNRTALSMAVLMPIALVSALHSLLAAQRGQLPGVDLHSALVVNLSAVALLFGLYTNLTAAYVTRRGELVLKRLRTGELTDGEILGGTALPSALLALLQVALITAAAAVLLGLAAPVNAVLVLLGLLLAAGLLAALAALTSGWTRTVEAAGLTTLPVVLVTLAGSGLIVPFSVLPAPLADAGRLLPASSALELLRIGWLGGDGSGAPTGFAGSWLTALPYLGGAVAWLALAAWAALRGFRWEPRG